MKRYTHAAAAVLLALIMLCSFTQVFAMPLSADETAGSLPAEERETTRGETSVSAEENLQEQSQSEPEAAAADGEDGGLFAESALLQAEAQREEISALTEDEAHLKSFAVNSIFDGVEPFDTDEDPASPYYKLRRGNDESSNNLRVRSFDKVSYDISFVAQSFDKEKKFSEAVLYFEFVLPLPAEKAEWDFRAMSWMDPGARIFTADVSYDFDKDGSAETVTCQILRGKKSLMKTDTQPTAIPGAGILNAVVQVKNMLEGETIRPVFTGWLGTNRSGSDLISDLEPVTGQAQLCTEHNILEAVSSQPDTVTVTSDLRLNVQLMPMSDHYAAIGSYDFSEGNSKALDKEAGIVTGRADAFGITLQLYNNPNRGLKGLELPVGPITFDVLLDTKFVLSGEGTALSADEQADVSKNYVPLVYTYGPQAEASVDERPLGELSSYAVAAAPKNSGMTGLPSLSCYQGGKWSAEKEGAKVSFTVSDYAFQYNMFPNGNLGDSLNNDRYFDPAVGVQHIGSFSGGSMWIVTPFHNNGTTDPVKKGIHIVDEYGEAGNFETSVKDVNLRSSSQSGEDLVHVTDNSNQSNTEDDMAVRTVYLAPGGEFDFRIAWTKIQEETPSWAFSDVLGRASHVTGSWALNGQDTAVRGQELALGLGVHYSEHSDKANRLTAANILAKFDPEAVTLRDQQQSSGTSKFGLEYTLLYGVKADGSSWSSQDEMNHAVMEDLRYYDSLEKIPAGDACVALLAEVRPKNGDADQVRKNQQGARLMIETAAVVREDPDLINNVYATVIGGEIYSRRDWNSCGGHIPSLLNNDPSAPLELPEASFKEYRNYEKAYYNEAGFAGGHTGNQNHGDSLRIQKVVPTIIKQVAQQESGKAKEIYQMDSGQRYVDFVLKASLSDLPEGIHENSSLIIEDTLDKYLEYVDGSAFLGGSYLQNEKPGRPGKVSGGRQVNPTISKDAGGRTVLSWSFDNVSSEEEFPPLYYSAQIGTPGDEEHDVKHNQTLVNRVTVRGDGDFRPKDFSTRNLAEADIIAAKLKYAAISKTASPKYYNPGDGMGYELSAGNNGDSLIEDVIVLDTLPYDGDQAGSSFEGELRVGRLLFNADALSNKEEWKAYYTTDLTARDTVSAQYKADELRNGLAKVSGLEVRWHEAAIGADGRIAELEGKAVTAFAFVGNIRPGEACRAHLDLVDGESQSGNLFINTLSQGDNQTAARVYVVQREISGIPWLDANEDGQRQPEEKPLFGVKITLLSEDEEGRYVPLTDENGRAVSVESSATEKSESFFIRRENNLGQLVRVKIQAVAEAGGTYRFIGVPEGRHGIRFESGSRSLALFKASPVNVGSDLTDSDGIPLYSDGSSTYSADVTLEKTEIPDIDMPAVGEMQGTYLSSLYHDSGFSPALKTVEAEKIWRGSDERPEIYFTLYQNITGQEPVRVLDKEGNPYIVKLTGDKVSFGELPAADSDGHELFYSVKETDENGNDYVPEGFSKEEQGLTVINTYIPQETTTTGETSESTSGTSPATRETSGRTERTEKTEKTEKTRMTETTETTGEISKTGEKMSLLPLSLLSTAAAASLVSIYLRRKERE